MTDEKYLVQCEKVYGIYGFPPPSPPGKLDSPQLPPPPPRQLDYPQPPLTHLPGNWIPFLPPHLHGKFLDIKPFKRDVVIKLQITILIFFVFLYNGAGAETA